MSELQIWYRYGYAGSCRVLTRRLAGQETIQEHKLAHLGTTLGDVLCEY